MNKASVVAVFLFVACCFAQVSQLSYVLGQNYVYDVSGVVQNNAYDTSSNSFTDGYYSFMQSTMVMQATSENETCYMFVMNMFDTTVSVNNTNDNGDELKGSEGSGGSSDALGYDVYFIQDKAGQVLEIIYETDDSPYYLNIKFSVINALQTAVTAAGQSQTVDEADMVGVHTSVITGSVGNGAALLLTKTFSQNDITEFADPNLSSSNVQYTAQAALGLHSDGYVLNAVVQQTVILVNSAPSVTSRNLKDDNTTGFTSDLSSAGSLSFQYLPNSDYSAVPMPTATRKNAVSNSMFEYARAGIAVAAKAAFTLTNFEQTLKATVRDTAPIKTVIPTLQKLGKHLSYNPDAVAALRPYFADAEIMNDFVSRDKIFFIITVAQDETLLIESMFNAVCAVRMRALLAAAQYKTPSADLVNLVQKLTVDDTCDKMVQNVASNVLTNFRGVLSGKSQQVFASDFPYNKTYSGDVTLGGKIAGVTFTADLFAGSNFDCTQPTFNYEVSAEISATASLFGYNQEAFDAQFIYGQAAGSPLADAITLSVWGNQVYNSPIPTVDCSQGSYPLGQTAPGFNLQYTIWVSIIPVTFNAGATLTLSADWGWQVCPAQLTAQASITGDADLVFAAGSYTDLLLLRAGFDLSTSFNTAITPQIDLDGSQCQISFLVDGSQDPMDAEIYSYYEWRECKFLFFDCKWGQHNQQTWWQWDAPAKSYTLFEETYKIASA